MHERTIQFIPLPRINVNRDRLVSPRLVGVLDRIRFQLSENDPEGEMDEVTWFIREYPRVPLSSPMRRFPASNHFRSLSGATLRTCHEDW